MNKYTIVVCWSDEVGMFVAEVPELPGYVAYRETAKRALANAHQAIEMWIETAKEFGDPVPEPKGRCLQFA